MLARCAKLVHKDGQPHIRIQRNAADSRNNKSYNQSTTLLLNRRFKDEVTRFLKRFDKNCPVKSCFKNATPTIHIVGWSKTDTHMTTENIYDKDLSSDAQWEEWGSLCPHWKQRALMSNRIRFISSWIMALFYRNLPFPGDHRCTVPYSHWRWTHFSLERSERGLRSSWRANIYESSGLRTIFTLCWFRLLGRANMPWNARGRKSNSSQIFPFKWQK